MPVRNIHHSSDLMAVAATLIEPSVSDPAR
jgi:hypothetical protein